jgi:hypothetical protein
MHLRRKGNVHSKENLEDPLIKLDQHQIKTLWLLQQRILQGYEYQVLPYAQNNRKLSFPFKMNVLNLQQNHRCCLMIMHIPCPLTISRSSQTPVYQNILLVCLRKNNLFLLQQRKSKPLLSFLLYPGDLISKTEEISSS